MLSLRSSAALLLLTVVLLPGCDDAPPYTGPGLPKDYEKYKKPANPVVELEVAAGPASGKIKIELFEEDAPAAVANFIELSEKGYYNGTPFHRIMKDFMIQGGDKKGDGTGDPGYKFKDEFDPKNNKHEQYSVSMANSGPNTNGSQFFIVTNPSGTPWLNEKHTVFGKVIEGKDVVDKLNVVPVNGERPVTPVVITTAKVVSKRNHEYKLADSDKVQPKTYTPEMIQKMMQDSQRRGGGGGIQFGQ